MKRLVVSFIILLSVLFVLSRAIAAPERAEPRPVTGSRTPAYRRPGTRPVRTDPNSVTAGSEAPPDANTIKSKLKEFEGLEQELMKVSKGSGRETREWMRGPVEEMYALAKAVEEQIDAELTFVRQVAAEEGSLKTTAAIDGLILERQGRFDKIFRRMEASIRRGRRGQRGFRRDGVRGRGMDDRYRQRDPYQDRYNSGGRYSDRDPYRDNYQERDPYRRR